MKVPTQIALLALLLWVFSACDQNRVFDEYKSTGNLGWHKDSVMVFEFTVSDTLQNHNLYINVRNDVKYDFSNLWLFLEISQPNGTTRSDTFQIVLAEPSGKWLGKGFGGVKTRETVYKRSVYFPASGKYSLTVQHGMRAPVLTGIADVGLRVEKQ